MVAIFPKLCLWRLSLCSNLGGIGPEKLYRATLNAILWDKAKTGLTLSQDVRTPLAKYEIILFIK